MNIRNLYIIILLVFASKIYGQDWTLLGSTYSNPSPYPHNYFLLFDLNNFSGNVSAEFEIMVLAYDNYMYHSRSSIFVSRHSSTPTDRVDGITHNYISGRPEQLEVIVKKNQIWVKANQKWGSIYYRPIIRLGYGSWTSPLTLSTTRPNEITYASSQPFYYDFDNSKVNLFTSLLSNGNVGLGTTNPDAKLTVKGKIHAEEVKIDLSVPAPDYVFNKEYELLTIEEVQKHIAEKGHLPNIPSATEMEANGVELGLMNMKLLEKIEELTLYTIEQEQKLKTQENINEELQRKNEELERRLNKIESLLKN